MSKNKDTYYFSHDSNARNDEKILAIRMRHKAEGYAVYFMILERLRECTDNMSVKDYNVLAFDFRVSADLVKSVVEDFGLFVFTDDGKHFYSERMQRNMKIVKEKSEKAREAVKKRWKNQQKETEEIPPKYERNTDVLQTYNECNTIKVKESKVNKSKVKENTPKPPQGADTSFKKNEDALNSEKIKKEKKVPPKKTKRFEPPSLQKVQEYCKERNNGVDAWRWYNFYQAKDWFIGKNKMKDWRAAVRTWEKPTPTNPITKPKLNATNPNRK